MLGHLYGIFMNDEVARYEIQSMKYIKYEITKHNVLATYNVCILTKQMMQD